MHKPIWSIGRDICEPAHICPIIWAKSEQNRRNSAISPKKVQFLYINWLDIGLRGAAKLSPICPIFWAKNAQNRGNSGFLRKKVQFFAQTPRHICPIYVPYFGVKLTKIGVIRPFSEKKFNFLSIFVQKYFKISAPIAEFILKGLYFICIHFYFKRNSHLHTFG